MAQYRLPFDNDSQWTLANANWDDPTSGHGDAPMSGQAYAFDFPHPKGGDVRAARGGHVILVVNDIDFNVPNLKKEGVPKDDPRLDPKFGGGNVVLIKHDLDDGDNTVAAYDHLTKGSVAVAVGQKVNQGDSIAKSGDTGNAYGPHLHFDVREHWTSPTDLGPTVPVHFEDANHKCWRPRVGDVLSSNNS